MSDYNQALALLNQCESKNYKVMYRISQPWNKGKAEENILFPGLENLEGKGDLERTRKLKENWSNNKEYALYKLQHFTKLKRTAHITFYQLVDSKWYAFEAFFI